jgi:hypothetical protein
MLTLHPDTAIDLIVRANDERLRGAQRRRIVSLGGGR